MTINGSGFTWATSVYFGSTAATSVTIVSDSQITARSPPEVLATVDVRVLSGISISLIVSADQFTYQTSTVTTLISSANPVIINTQVTYTATVSVGNGGTGSPTGNVEFFDNGTAITGCTSITLSGAEQAACTQSYGTASIQLITAEYLGSGNYPASTSTVLMETVNNSTPTQPPSTLSSTGLVSESQLVNTLGSDSVSPFTTTSSSVITNGDFENGISGGGRYGHRLVPARDHPIRQIVNRKTAANRWPGRR